MKIRIVSVHRLKRTANKVANKYVDSLVSYGKVRSGNRRFMGYAVNVVGGKKRK